MRYIPELDGLRAVAVLLVITAHTGGIALSAVNGYLGVTIFFVLSGYLITSIGLAEEVKNGSVSLSAFYVRRSFRIFPLYYFVLLVYCVLIFGLHVSPDKQIPLREALPYYLVYLQEVPLLAGIPGKQLTSLPFFQSWSLGIEEKFYLLWPLVCFIVLRRRSSLRIPAALLMVIGCAMNRFTRPYIPILFGCMLGLAFQIPGFRRLVECAKPWTIWAVAGLLLLVHLAILPSWQGAFSYDLYAALFAAFLALLVGGSSPLRMVLGFSPLVFIGKVSYGIYLVHLLCIGLVRDKLHFHNTSLLFVVSVALSLTVAMILHFTFEKPLIEFGRNFSQRLTNNQANLRPAPVSLGTVNESKVL